MDRKKLLFCINCKFSIKTSPVHSYQCTHPETLAVNIVNGELCKLTCSDARSMVDKGNFAKNIRFGKTCGENAIFYEEREEPLTSLKGERNVDIRPK